MQEVHIRKRINSSDVQALEETVATGQESSVEIRENSKGEPSLTLKVYHANPFQAGDDAIALYKYLLKRLREL